MPKNGRLPEFPKGCEYLWDWWCEMRRMNGDDFSATAIKNWFDLNQIKPTAREVKAIHDIWQAFLRSK